MAFIDYGAILKVDGKIIEKDMFMSQSDTGYSPQSVEVDGGVTISIPGEFFVLAGDEDLLLAFYKTYFYIIRNGKATSILPLEISETIEGISVRFLDNNMNYGTLPRHYKFKYYANGKCHIVRGVAEVTSRRASAFWRHKNHRYYAEWWHKGKHYEVVYGYGIDNYEVYSKIKKVYNYTDKEMEFMENFYKCRKE